MKKAFLLLAFVLFAGCTVIPNRTSVITDGQDGYLSFQVSPPETKVYVDGEFVGLAKYFNGKKRRLKVLPGQHTIELKCDGYKDISRTVYMSDTQEQFKYDMIPAEGESGSGVIRT